MSVFRPFGDEMGNVRVKTGNFGDKFLGNNTVSKKKKTEIELQKWLKRNMKQQIYCILEYWWATLIQIKTQEQKVGLNTVNPGLVSTKFPKTRIRSQGPALNLHWVNSTVFLDKTPLSQFLSALRSLNGSVMRMPQKPEGRREGGTLPEKAELNNVCACARLRRGKRILSRLHVWFSVLLLLDVVSLDASLLQNHLHKLCIPPKYFQTSIVTFKTLKIEKILQRRQNVSVLHASPYFPQISLSFKPGALKPTLLTAYLSNTFRYSALPLGDTTFVASRMKDVVAPRILTYN